MGKIEGQNQVKMGEKRKGGGRRKKGGKGRGGCGLFYVDNLVLMWYQYRIFELEFGQNGNNKQIQNKAKLGSGLDSNWRWKWNRCTDFFFYFFVWKREREKGNWLVFPVTNYTAQLLVCGLGGLYLYTCIYCALLLFLWCALTHICVALCFIVFFPLCFHTESLSFFLLLLYQFYFFSGVLSTGRRILTPIHTHTKREKEIWSDWISYFRLCAIPGNGFVQMWKQSTELKYATDIFTCTYI